MINTIYDGTHSFLLEYIQKCKSGEILIGNELMLMLDIHLSHFDDPDILIEFEDAHKRIDFIEKECKHFEAPFAGKPFILELFQKAFIESLYIFKIYDDEAKRFVRLYQEFLFLVARKNGKTPLISAINLAEFFCGEAGTRIMCTSNDHEQASLMFDAIAAMREESKRLASVTRKNITGIYFGNPKKPKYSGKFSYRNKGYIRKISAKTGAKEGRNVKIVSADEVHEMKDNTAVMPHRQSLSTQEEPIYGELTTEGVVNDGYLDGRLVEARQVLNGEIERPRWNIWLYTQDSEQEIWQDEKTWVKSNPGLGVIKRWNFMRQMLNEARTSQATRVFVLSKDFNLKQNNAAAWLTPDDIKDGGTFDIEEFRNSFGLGAADLSKSGDLTSARVLLMKPNSQEKFFVQKYFIPESKIAQLSKEDRKKFEQWIREDRIIVSPGNENDFSLVTAWFYRLYIDYGIRIFKTGYDRWSAVYFVKDMEEHGFDMDRISQEDWGSMSEPMKLVEADLKSGLINTNECPIDRWCLENTALALNSRQDIRPVKVKGQDDKKIDGAVTMIMCYKMYIDNRTDFLAMVGR